ncbi:cupin domain-containing protein [Aliikangiella sp. IMCC44359]|uniref:cupin domain-containing protein n=1 Tax=Aliikangiella sp. IMCC44359 TaxID=3459125 RepID=UPI00403AC51A
MNKNKSKLRIENINTIEKNPVGNHKNFSANVGRFGQLFNMKDMSCSVVELKPGNKAWPYHLHYGLEELFIILQGEGSIRYDDEMHPIKSGDVIFTPPGEGTAHQIINTSKSDLQYLALSTMKSPEVCYYPDSGKYGSYVFNSDSPVKTFIAHESNAAEYFEGEEE